MRAWILSFSLGVAAAGYIPHLPDYPIVLVFLLPYFFSLRYRCLFLASAFSLGLFWLFSWAGLHQQKIIPATLEQQDIWVRGEVSGLPQTQDGNTRFTFRVESFCTEALVNNCHTRVNYLNNGKLLLNDYSQVSYLPGQHWFIKVRLKRPHGFANPGGFDYERWLFQEKVVATGYVRQDDRSLLLAPSGRSIFYPDINLLRFTIQQQLKQLPLVSKGFLSALMIGDRYLITDEHWSLLTHTGTNHLMVISGLHIGLVAGVAFTLGFYFWRLFPRLCLAFPAPRMAALLGVCAAVFYAALAGFSLPVQRALVMVICLMSGHLLVRQVSAACNLCLALFLVLLLDPLAPQTAGFWLSFFAVIVLLLCLMLPAKENDTSLIKRLTILLRCQSYLFFCMMPFMLMFFGQVSLLAPLVNILAIPFIGVLIVPLCLLSLLAGFVNPGYFATLVTLPDFLVSGYIDVLSQLVSHLDFLLIPFPNLPLWLLVLMLGIMLFQFFNRHWLTRLAGILIIGSSFSYRSERPAAGNFILDVLDVGQGLATVITTHTHMLVYDTGPAFSPRFNAGSGIIEPFLTHQNLGNPDLLIVSHGDNDHAGGITALNALYPETRIIAGEQLMVAGNAGKGGVDVSQCLAGQSWIWDEIRFEFLYPVSSNLAGNNASCVLKISSNESSVLLPGDIEIEGELSLLKESRYVLAADILIAPHHGSLTSSIGPFIRSVDPQFVVFATGYLNRFNHPHPDVLARYQRQEITPLETALSGAIRFQISADEGVEAPEFYRTMRPAFWHLP